MNGTPQDGKIPVTLVGHPFALIGMGEQMRSHIAACRAVRLDIGFLDVFRGSPRTDPEHLALLRGLERDRLPGGIRIFHVNGDEVQPTIEALHRRGDEFSAGYNVIFPAWELPVYPKPWVEQLRRFDEVWALSRFMQESLAASGVESALVTPAVEMAHGPILPRRYFGVRESAFVLLHFFDLSSYESRKNPQAVLELFNRIRADEPFLDVHLVLKVKQLDRAAGNWRPPGKPDAGVTILAEPLDSLGVRSLVAASDVFVSLHRSEGFGRGLAEAMSMGRLALGTAWSGNLDFMTAANSLPVRADMIPVAAGAYPFGEGQMWADPDIGHAAALLRPVLADPARGRTIAMRGQSSVFRSHGYRAVGLRILERINAIAASIGSRKRAPEKKSASRQLPAKQKGRSG